MKLERGATLASLVCREAVGKSSAVERCDLASLGGGDSSGLGEDRTAQTCRDFKKSGHSALKSCESDSSL